MNIFKDGEGNISSMNLVWIISIITMMGMWIFLSLKSGTLQHLTAGDALWFTTLFSGKVLQGFYEKKNPQTTQTKSGLVQDSEGKASPSRIIWIVAVLGIVGTWGFLSYQAVELQHFTTGDAGWFAALFGSKVGQTYVERAQLKQPE